jgi:GxxExxY protein
MMGAVSTDAFRVTETIIGCGIEVHRSLGPGLLESTYEACTVWELTRRGVRLERQVKLPVVYRGVHLDCGYRLDLVVEESVIVEFKSAASIAPIHEAQMLTYLKLSGLPFGLILNFNVPVLRLGIRRLAGPAALDRPPEERPPRT